MEKSRAGRKRKLGNNFESRSREEAGIGGQCGSEHLFVPQIMEVEEKVEVSYCGSSCIGPQLCSAASSLQTHQDLELFVGSLPCACHNSRGSCVGTTTPVVLERVPQFQWFL